MSGRPKNTAFAGRPPLSRMAVQGERLPTARLGDRLDGQLDLLVEYPVAGIVPRWRVVAGPAHPDTPQELREAVERGAGPLANDLLVLLGTAVNDRARRPWNVDSAEERTFSFGVAQALEAIGRSRTATNYTALEVAAWSLQATQIVAEHSWRDLAEDGSGRREWRGRVAFSLINRVQVSSRQDDPGGARIRLEVSLDYARALATDYRLVATDAYWALQGDVARRLYRLLEVQRVRYEDGREVTDHELRVPVAFLRDRLPIHASKTVYIQRRLEAAHAELERAGYLHPTTDAHPRYVEAADDDFRRHPAFPGARAKPVAAWYRIVRRPPALPQRGEFDAARQPPALAEIAAAFAALGASAPVADTLEARVRRVCRTTGDGNVASFKSACERLSWEDFDRVTREIEVDGAGWPPAARARSWHARARPFLQTDSRTRALGGTAP